MRHTYLLFIVGLALTLGTGIGGTVDAQAPTPLRDLEISVWPEYDDPRVLIILAGTLDATEGTLRVPLPEGADINAVAYSDEDGRLLTAPWELEEKEGQPVLVSRLPAPQFQVEYYLDAIRRNEETVISLRIPVPQAPIAQARLTVQQPANTTDLAGNPALEEKGVGFGGLRYFSRNLGPLKGGDLVAQEVRYIRLAPGLSAPPRATAATPSPPPTSEPGDTWRPVVVGLLIAVGIGLILIAWLRARGGTPAIAEQERPLPTTTLPRYCPNCGHPFRPQDRYCAQCGTRRKAG